MNYVDKIVSAFGGVRPMAAAIRKPTSTVGSWSVRGSIPDDAKPLVLSRANELGLGLTKADFFPAAEPNTDPIHADAASADQAPIKDVA